MRGDRDVEKECKKIKSQRQADLLHIARLETELEQARRASAAALEDAKRLRSEKMEMEREVAVHRAEKQLSEARQDYMLR